MDTIHTVYVHFERDESRDIIIFNQPLTSTERSLFYASGYNDIALENCVAMVPIKYPEDHTDSFYFTVLPQYLPLYSWEFGRSSYTLQRTLSDNNVLTLNLYSDTNWAIYTRDLIKQHIPNLNNN